MSVQGRLEGSQRLGYRGALVYRQEDGYHWITMTVSVGSDERSRVTTHAFGLPIAEEAEHLMGVDLYQFGASYGTVIQLTVGSPGNTEEAWFRVGRGGVSADASVLHLSSGCSEERCR